MKEKILSYIKENGPVNIADYMAMCLYDPEQGYYNSQSPFGEKGDFITAPELTPLFGEMLGLWVADVWAQLGRPAPFNLIELGPGRGVLAADMLRALGKAAPACLDACHLHLVEISPRLQKIQKKHLHNAPCSISWHDSITTTPPENAVAIGNELLDALPVRQYEKAADNHYYERLVTVQKGQLTLTLSPDPATPQPQNNLPISEHSPAMEALLESFKSHLRDGVLLLLDYGTERPDKNISGDTLQAVRQHQFEDIFAAPGQADITWHIPFDKVADILEQDKCSLTDMGLFLTELGLPVRAEQAHRAATSDQQRAHIESAVRRLMDPNQMGRHFKVLCWQGKDGITPAGFVHAGQQ